VEGNTLQSRVGDTEDVSFEEAQQPSGNGEAGAESSGDLDEDLPLNVDAILDKWEANSIGQGYSDGTLKEYRRYFGRFAADFDLAAHDRKWLVSHGKMAVIQWLVGKPDKSRGVALAALQSVWTFGIPEVAWPINRKRDFGKRMLPQSGQRSCPTDEDIRPIFLAAEREEDAYVKSLILTGLSTGARPGNQLGQLQWADVWPWSGGLAIVAESKPGRKFKTDSPMIVRLPPMASDALKAWRSETPNNAPNDYIWPRRHYKTLTTKERSVDHTLLREYQSFLRRHKLVTWVRMAHFRHWVEYRGEKDGIPAVHLAYMRGHAVKSATEGRLGYSGNRKAENVLEDQEARWPEGPCGAFGASVVVRDELSPYAAVMREYANGNMTTQEMANRIETIRLKLSKQVPSVEP